MEKIKKIIKIIIELILIVIIIFSLVMIIRWCISSINNRKISKKVNNEIKIDEILDGKRELDFNYLYNINSDTVGYLTIDELGINYPVVKTTNNDFYLNHSFDKSKNIGGWIFMDYRNSSSIEEDRNTVIYGHNMKDGSMFGKLKGLKNSDIDTIYYYEKKHKTTFKIISIYEIEEESYYITTHLNDDEYLDFLNTIKNRSIKEFNYNPSIEDKILTLSTCSNNGKRFVVHAAVLLD
ncbi:MAG: class B sortase [Bacilli bacterium]|nr:class B sortase [Bacilli bacterium]